MTQLQQPVLILGGFLITPEAYAPLAQWIQTVHGQAAEVVPVDRLQWLGTTRQAGWRRILDQVDTCAQSLQQASPGCQVTLIGHSSGGVMLRLYLGEEPFAGRSYAGHHRCNRLVTLGSPHQAKRATRLRSLVDQRYPGCPFADQVDYVSVAGRLDLAGFNASNLSRLSARRSYGSICDDQMADGDGLVPLCSALLNGSRQLVLEDTAHGGLFGKIWYGSSERISQWWPFACHGPTRRPNP